LLSAAGGISDIVAPCARASSVPALRKAGDAGRLGIYGFGAAAHIIAQLALQEAKPSRLRARVHRGPDLRRDVGAAWAGGSDEPAPEELDAAILLRLSARSLPRRSATSSKAALSYAAAST
jgi:propanol-preferring alcohol dehydrogenase